MTLDSANTVTAKTQETAASGPEVAEELKDVVEHHAYWAAEGQWVALARKKPTEAPRHPETTDPAVFPWNHPKKTSDGQLVPPCLELSQPSTTSDQDVGTPKPESVKPWETNAQDTKTQTQCLELDKGEHQLLLSSQEWQASTQLQKSLEDEVSRRQELELQVTELCDARDGLLHDIEPLRCQAEALRSEKDAGLVHRMEEQVLQVHQRQWEEEMSLLRARQEEDTRPLVERLEQLRTELTRERQQRQEKRSYLLECLGDIQKVLEERERSCVALMERLGQLGSGTAVATENAE